MQKTLMQMIETRKTQTKERNRIMKNKANRSIITGLVGAAILAGATMSLQAETVFWGATSGNGGNGNWEDAGWYTTKDGGNAGTFSGPTSQPGSSDDVYVRQTLEKSTITVNSDVGTVNSLDLDAAGGDPRAYVGSLIIDNNGSLNITGGLITYHTWGGDAGHITVNDGGSLTVGGTLRVGTRSGTLFEFIQNGGTTEFGNVLINQRGVPEVVYEMKGGSMKSGSMAFGGGRFEVRDSDARRFEISGGTVNITGAVTDTDPGTYRVIGSGATSISLGSMTLDVANTEANGGPSKISFLLDENGVTLTEISGAATFAGTVLEIGLMDGFDGAGITGAGVTFDLLTATSISATNLTLDQSLLPANRWVTGWEIVNGGNGQILQVTLVPEPSSLALLGLVSLVLMKRRRRCE